jgi:hypothetical protein
MMFSSKVRPPYTIAENTIPAGYNILLNFLTLVTGYTIPAGWG